MLRRALAAAAAALALFAAPGARAQGDEPDDALRRPDRLTAGIADQLLGQLSPDETTLYYVSTRHTTHELFTESVERGHGRLLFDEDADVTWPRVSPDGKSLLYVSFRDQADGRLCVRDLPDGDGRRCLDDKYAALEAEWIDARRIVVLVRNSIDGDLSLHEVSVGSSLAAKPLLEHSLTTPTVSPDGRWVVFVPITRYAPAVGVAFAARAGKRLEAVALEHPTQPVPLDIDLPGRTGQPTFSRDGRWLYFTQFFSDTNHDGIIDANDHGVLFRVPVSFAGTPRAGTPEQLTDTSWNCQYPAPSRTQLVATCAHGRNLDIYTLPLDGEVPSEWDAARLRDEIGVATKHDQEQILYFRRLAKETSVTARRLVMTNLVRLHLELDEFRAAEFYAEHVERLHDRATAGIARPLLTLVDHRRAVRQRERGRRSDDFKDEEQQRLDGLAEKPSDSPAALAMMHLVRSEIADGMGDFARARAELDAATIDDATPHAVILFYYARADALYRELDDRPALVAACRRLAQSKALELDDRLDYARAAVRAMTRGLPFDAADAALAKARPAESDDSELAFAVDLGRAVLAIRDGDPPKEARRAVVALYERQTRPDRRRVVIYDAVHRAAQLGADKLIEALARRYLDDTKDGTAEHRRAVRLFRRAMVGRGMRHEAAGKSALARADFDAVTQKTGSYESAVASIEVRERSGESLAAIGASAANYAPPLRAFATAYVGAETLPELDGDAFDRAAQAALASLRAHWADLLDRRAVRALDGAIFQQRYLRTRDAELAERANVHDLVALELAKNNARYRAMILGNLGMLHVSVGNWRIALSYLDQRDALPYRDDVTSLAVRLAHARALFHVGKDADASRVADDAVDMIDRAPKLAEYRALVLDRAALYALSAGKFERALALYDRLVPIVDASRARDPETLRNRFVTRLARAAAALGAEKPARALDDLAVTDRALRDASMSDVLQWPHASAKHTVAAYRLIAAGLHAHAFGALGQTDAERKALTERRAILAAWYARSPHRKYARDLSLVEAHLAENAMQLDDAKTAGAWAAAAMGHADAARGSAKVDYRELDVLWLAAELGALRRAPTSLPLVKRLADARAALDEDGGHAARRYARWFEIYGTLVAP